MSMTRGVSDRVDLFDNVVFPACNVHSFIFSNPFALQASVEKFDDKGKRNNHVLPPVPPHKPIFFDTSSSAALTYSRLRSDTLRLAHGIHQRFGSPRLSDAFGHGSRAGPVVIIHLPNCIVWPVLVLGFLAAGWTVTGTNPGYTPSELAHVIDLCEPRLVICYPGAGGENNMRAACPATGINNISFVFVEPGEDSYGIQHKAPQEYHWTSLLSSKELEVLHLPEKEANFRVALIMWTSGTTGKPKGALMSHRALVAGLVQVCAGQPVYSQDEKWIAVAPFYHIFGLYNQLLLAPCVGATVIILAKFDLEKYLRLVTAHKATHLHIAPPIAVALAKSDLLDKPWCSLDSVVSATAGGAPLSPEVIREVWKRSRVVVTMGYGMSETGGISGFEGNTWGDVEPHLGTSGAPLVGNKIMIIDKDGKAVGENTPGEILVRSPAQMLGYLKDPQATAETLDENGVHTGDIGYIDDAGYIQICDRQKELIKYKGFQVSPVELEGVIAGLSEVQDVAVSSLYSATQGTELPLAFVVPRSPALLQLLASPDKGEPPRELVTLADKVKMIVEKHCIHYKRLRGGIIFVSAITKSPSGKILRRLLKTQQGLHVQCYAASRESRL